MLRSISTKVGLVFLSYMSKFEMNFVKIILFIIRFDIITK